MMETQTVQQVRAVTQAEQACIDIGGIADAFGLTCCASSCGICGGAGCELRPGEAAACCADALYTANQVCGHPPCTMEVDPLAAEARTGACLGLGGIPDASGMMCCASTCGSCGGTGCEGREGGADGCCSDNLDAANVPCGEPPCLMETHAQAQAREAQVFSAECKAHGGVPDSSGLKCCAASCGTCGGDGCTSRPGGADMCCGDNLGAANQMCGDPACVFHTNPREAEARANACKALGGVADPSGLACCPASCGSCGGLGCDSRPGGAASCCGDQIDEANELCGNPPCLMSSFTDGGPGGEGNEWWRFDSGDVSANAARDVSGNGLGARFSYSSAGSLEEYLFSPMKMRDRKVDAGADEVIDEWSPEDYVDSNQYPSSRLAGGIGAAGSSIRDPTVIVCWSLFLLFAIAAIVHILIYHREWFVPPAFDDDEELLRPGSPRSVGSV